MTGCTGHYHEPGCPHFDQPTEAPRADGQPGLRLGVEQERRLRLWPKDRIRPKSVALGVISLLAEVQALRENIRMLERENH